MVRSFLLLLLPVSALAQKPSTTGLSFVPHVGLSWQSTFLHYISPEPNNSTVLSHNMPSFPYSAEKGTQGFGLDAGATIAVNATRQVQLGLKGNARSRYDYFHQKPEGGEAKTYYLDLSGAFQVAYRNKKDREITAELGATANQLGKQYTYESASPTPRTIDFGYTSFFAGGGYDVAQLAPKAFLHLGAALNYIPNGHPAQPRFQYLNLLLRASVRFR